MIITFTAPMSKTRLMKFGKNPGRFCDMNTSQKLQEFKKPESETRYVQIVMDGKPVRVYKRGTGYVAWSWAYDGDPGMKSRARAAVKKVAGC